MTASVRFLRIKPSRPRAHVEPDICPGNTMTEVQLSVLQVIEMATRETKAKQTDITHTASDLIMSFIRLEKRDRITHLQAWSTSEYFAAKLGVACSWRLEST